LTRAHLRAYHRENFDPSTRSRVVATNERMIELRLAYSTAYLAVVAALAGCATTAPPPSLPPVHPPIVVGPPPDIAEPPAALSQPLQLVVAPDPVVILPFSAEVSAQLEELPPQSDDLWDRIRKGYAMPELDDAEVAKWEAFYSERPEYVARIVDRSRRYLYHIVVEVEQRGMPLEIALLPMIESAFNPHAMSSARASGIWQFMPATGKDFGLNQNFWFDSRRDVIAATEGALSYLQKLYTQFNDWQLALAAYNWGEGNVARAIERNQRLGLPTDYQNLRMPNETRNYLPKLQAVKNIIRDPSKFNLALDDIPDAPYFAVVKTTRKMDVKRAAELAEMNIEEFQYLNPRYNRPVIAGADEYALLLPIDRAELFAAKLELTDQPLVSWQAYRLRPGETLPQIAGRVGMPVETLRAVNGIAANVRVPSGHTLLIPAQRVTHESAETLTQAVFTQPLPPRPVVTTVPQGRTFYYRVNRGDTLVGIASRFAVSPRELVALESRRQARHHGGAAVAGHQRACARRGEDPACGCKRRQNGSRESKPFARVLCVRQGTRHRQYQDPDPFGQGVRARGLLAPSASFRSELQPRSRERSRIVMGPLAGLRVLEFEAIGPVPFCGMMLADMGADVLLVDRRQDPQLGLALDRGHDVMLRGRRSVTLDLKSASGVAAARALAARADALIEGFRPGVMERAGLGPDVLLTQQPRLVYGRMTGWGTGGAACPPCRPRHRLHRLVRCLARDRARGCSTRAAAQSGRRFRRWRHAARIRPGVRADRGAEERQGSGGRCRDAGRRIAPDGHVLGHARRADVD
jgi:membrane-bound lytic murein transglycosylase D